MYVCYADFLVRCASCLAGGWPIWCECGVAVAGGCARCGCGVAVAGAGVYDSIPKISAVCFLAMAVVLMCVSLWCVPCLFACCVAWLLAYAEIPNDDSLQGLHR